LYIILSVVCDRWISSRPILDDCDILLIWFWWLQYNHDMKTSAVDIDHVQSENNSCLSCRVSGSVAFLLVATYFYFRCKHIKPVYYLGTPSMHNTIYHTIFHVCGKTNTANWLIFFIYRYDIFSCSESIRFETFQWLIFQNQP